MSDLPNPAYADALAAWRHEKARAEAAEARCARLEAVVQFYADSANWKAGEIGWSEIGTDAGRKARAALSDIAQHAPTTWNPEHPDYCKTGPLSSEQGGGDGLASDN